MFHFHGAHDFRRGIRKSPISDYTKSEISSHTQIFDLRLPTCGRTVITDIYLFLILSLALQRSNSGGGTTGGKGYHIGGYMLCLFRTMCHREPPYSTRRFGMRILIFKYHAISHLRFIFRFSSSFIIHFKYYFSFLSFSFVFTVLPKVVRQDERVQLFI